MRQEAQQKLAEEQLRTSTLVAEKQDLEEKLKTSNEKLSGTERIGTISKHFQICKMYTSLADIWNCCAIPRLMNCNEPSQ